jgi:plasmid stabilization system protein ParE
VLELTALKIVGPSLLPGLANLAHSGAPAAGETVTGTLPSSARRPLNQEATMPRGDKSKYTDKQKRKAEHIEESYEDRGVPTRQAERRAWATVNKESGGGNKSGSGRNVPDTHVSSRKGGRIGGAAAAARPASARSASAKKAARTRARKKKA